MGRPARMAGANKASHAELNTWAVYGKKTKKAGKSAGQVQEIKQRAVKWLGTCLSDLDAHTNPCQPGASSRCDARLDRRRLTQIDAPYIHLVNPDGSPSAACFSAAAVAAGVGQREDADAGINPHMSPALATPG
jgi:hypothetical protein